MRFAQLISQDFNYLMWYYLDNQQKVQGPFSSFQMDLWVMAGLYFTVDMKIAVWKPVNWKTIKTLIESPSSFIADSNATTIQPYLAM